MKFVASDAEAGVCRLTRSRRRELILNALAYGCGLNNSLTGEYRDRENANQPQALNQLQAAKDWQPAN